MKKGFTLAEVLITLSIIGIVAALTIPTLVANYQKQVYVTQLKKFYTQMMQALTNLETETGCTGNLSCTGAFDDPSGTMHTGGDWYHPSVAASEKAGAAIAKHFNVAKNCGSTEQGCTYVGNWGDPWRDNYISDGNSMYRFLTQDGFSVIIFSFGANCTHWSSDWARCGRGYVDVNGPKKPNTVGRDRFQYMFISSSNQYGNNLPDRKLYMLGSNPSDYWKNSSGIPIKCLVNSDGSISSWDYCSGRIMDEGWQMNY